MPAMGPARLTDPRPEVLERLYGRLLDEGKSMHVVHAVHRVLRSALGEAVRRHHLSQNPASVARPPRVVAPEIVPLTSDECRAVLQAARGTTNAARWSVALALGLRQGETLGLTWDDVDLGHGVIRIRRAVQRRTWQHGCIPKVGGDPSCERARGGDCPKREGGGLLLVELKTRASRRAIVLPAPLLVELSAHRAEQLQHKAETGGVWDDSLNLVFADDVGGLIDPARDFREWKRLLERAGVREVRLHDARHTAATLLLIQGVDLRTVMSIMGWTEMATGQRYMHAVDEMRRQGARRMSEALWTTGQEP
jgi:integrase